MFIVNFVILYTLQSSPLAFSVKILKVLAFRQILFYFS